MGHRCIIGTEPVTKQYEIQSLECPSCGSVVRLVQRRAEQVRHRRRVLANFIRRSGALIFQLSRANSAPLSLT